jgi:hypothetical protein
MGLKFRGEKMDFQLSFPGEGFSSLNLKLFSRKNESFFAELAAFCG